MVFTPSACNALISAFEPVTLSRSLVCVPLSISLFFYNFVQRYGKNFRNGHNSRFFYLIQKKYL